jgi:TPR repeat protein/transcriptional regulator with XRE-family HTH domain
VTVNLAETVFAMDRPGEDERCRTRPGRGRGATVDKHAAEELREKLAEGLARSGLTTEQAAKRSGLGRTTVSQAMNGTNRVPSAHTVVVLAKLLRLDERDLLALQKAAAEGEPAAVTGPGRPIGECNPLDLEVHPAGAARHATKVLPGYVRRGHDEALAEVVDAAAAGRSGMAVLVGTSSTGKTRACWEAVQPLAATGWRLWHPYDSTRAEAALHGLGQVAPRTVVWLNEAQHYLDAGEQVAAALHRLLTDPGRAPTLVLATLWPDYAKVYADRPESGAPDPHARTRELLAGRRIEVAAEFDEADLRQAKRLAEAGDRLWAGVLAHDHCGRLAQHLAGAPELVRRYQEVSPVAKALLHVAMDARRLGAGLHLPLAFLTDAVEDYLHESELHLLEDEDWLERALAELAKPVHGDLAPLHRVYARRQRHHPSAGTGATGLKSASEPRYRLADYLDQRGRRERGLLCPPLSFWEAAHTFLRDPDDLANLGRAAEDRRRLSWARALCQRAADFGSISALVWLADRREWAGDQDEAETLYQRAADLGSISALFRLALRREQAGDRVEAEALYQRAVDAGDDYALVRVAEMREWAGDRDEAEVLYRRAADKGSPNGLRRLAEMREEAGDRDEAEHLALRAFDAGDAFALAKLVEMREEAGDRDEAEVLYRRAADKGSRKALVRLAKMREDAGDRDEAEALYRRAADAGDAFALAKLVEMREEAGDRDEAEHLALRAADAGDAFALAQLAKMGEDAGDRDEAEALYRRAADAGDAFALAQLAVMREEAGDRDEAEHLALRAFDAGDTFAFIRLAEIREEAGDRDEAERLALRAVGFGDTSTLVRLVVMREEAGDRDEAERLALRATDAGDTFALLELSRVRQVAPVWSLDLEPNGTPSSRERGL